MKRLVLMGTVGLFSLSLIGCNTMNSVGQAGGSVVHGGAHLVSDTGHVVGSTFNKGVGFLTGHSTTQKNVVYHNGHTYRLQNGKYVLVR